MIRFHLDAIEQLDVALEHLERKDKNATRFALSLIDNVAELVLSKTAQIYKHDNEYGAYFRQKPVHSVVDIEKATSTYFPDKLTGLVNLDALTVTQSQTLRNLHSFRNSAHHSGETHKNVLHSMSVFYLQQVCEIAVLYRSSTTCLNDWFEVPFRTRRYLGVFSYEHGKMKSPDNNILFTAYESLSHISNSFETDVVKTLSEDLMESIENFDEMSNFVLDGGLALFNKEEIFTFLQAPVKTFSSDAELYYYENKNCDGYKEYVKTKYSLKEKKNLVSSWKKRVKEISSMKEHGALEAYCRFLDEKKDFTTYNKYLDIHAEDLDDWTQLQIDIMRGK